MPTAPFNLGGFPFTPGDDEVIVDDTVNIDGTSPFQVLGIFNELAVDTGKGADLIDGRLNGTNNQGDNHIVAGIYNFAEIDTGHGRDTINGEVSYVSIAEGGNETSYYGLTSGRLGPGAPIKTGKNDDIINGTASVNGEADMVVGIGNTYINSGVGIDKITGTATLTPVEGIGSARDVSGIYNSKIVTEKGDDDVVGTATVEPGDSTHVSSIFGIHGSPNGIEVPIELEDRTVLDGHLEDSEWVDGYLGASIDVGRGNDLVEGTADVQGARSAFNVAGISGNSRLSDGGFDTDAVAFNDDEWEEMDLLSIEMGHGNDDLIGTANVVLSGESGSSQINGITGVHADTGNGTDLVEGRASVILSNEASVNGVNGIANSYIETGKSSDTIIGHASVHGNSANDAFNINGLCNVMIDTGKSRDIIEGTAEFSGSFVGAASVGIAYSDIDTGHSRDTVRGTALDAIGEGSSYGIAYTTIHLGKGDDEIIARGATEGVRMVEFFGEKGDDVFDLQSGTGFVHGGQDDDLLILEGNSGDFTFTDNGGGTGNITDLNGTNLDVASIEEFQFDNGTFDFGDLF